MRTSPITNTYKVGKRAVALSLKERDPAYLTLLPRWIASLEDGRSPVNDAVPWVTFRAHRWLSGIAKPGMHVREFGCGGSSVFFASRDCHVRSVEHDADWHKLVVDRITQLGKDATGIRHAPPDEPRTDDTYASERDGLTYHAYATAFESEPDASVDIAMVDGRARVACAHHIQAKIKPGGWLVLDNAERASYQPIHDALSSWHRIDFPGPGPYARRPWLTVAWQRPAD